LVQTKEERKAYNKEYYSRPENNAKKKKRQQRRSQGFSATGSSMGGY